MNLTQRNVALLSACQALLFTNNSTTIAINGLAGLALAPARQLATLPVTTWVIGAALTTLPASLLMSRVGRRAGFLTGAALGMVGAALAGESEEACGSCGVAAIAYTPTEASSRTAGNRGAMEGSFLRGKALLGLYLPKATVRNHVETERCRLYFSLLPSWLLRCS